MKPAVEPNRNDMNPGKNKILNWAVMLLLPMALLAFSSCSSTSGSSASVPLTKANATNVPAAYDIVTGGGSEFILSSITVTDTVVSVDAPQRRLGLKNEDGRITSYKVSPEAASFNQIQVGDQVKATVLEETAMFLKPAGSMESLGGGAVTVKVPNGTMPGVKNVDTLNFTAKVMAINAWLNQVTPQLANGQTETVRAPESVNLANVNVGDMVAVRITEATTLLLEKP
jgi:hypothetical protein